jgi:hypothetical protein
MQLNAQANEVGADENMVNKGNSNEQQANVAIMIKEFKREMHTKKKVRKELIPPSKLQNKAQKT